MVTFPRVTDLPTTHQESFRSQIAAFHEASYKWAKHGRIRIRYTLHALEVLKECAPEDIAPAERDQIPN